jgi:hypothetical protein
MKPRSGLQTRFPRLRHSLLLIPIIPYVLLSVIALDLPGLHYDEALEGGLPAVQLLNGQPIAALNGVVVHLGRWTLPLMVQNHIGASQIYAALPFILLGGPEASSLRAMTVVAGLVTLVAVYALTTQLYGRLAAVCTALWLATFASFIFWSRQGVFVTSLAPCFAMCALALGVYWWRARYLWAIGAAGFCLGMAMYSKLSALWLFNGVLGWGMITYGWTVLRAGLRRQPRAAQTPSGITTSAFRQPNAYTVPTAWVVGAAGLLLGVSPLILYNYLSGFATLRTVRSSATSTYLGVDNTQVLDNLWIRIDQAADVIRSGEHLWYLGGSFPNNVALVSVVVACMIILAAWIVDRGRGWRTLLFVPFLGLMVIVQSCFTISALWHTHFAIATPLPAIIFGVAVSRVHLWIMCLGQRWGRQLGSGLLMLAAGAVIITQVSTSWSYLNVLRSSGGLSFHASAIYQLSDSLERHSEQVIALDWGIATQLGYLSGGRMQVEEFYGGYEQTASPAFREELRKRFGQPALYVTHAENQEAFQRRAAFLETVADAGMWAERVDTIHGAEGVPLFEVWRVRPPGG